MTETSWGIELWDCFDKVLQEVSINNVYLSQTCSRYMRERAEVEKEYARGLRRLSNKYGASEEQNEESREREERGMEKAFRVIMEEVGYQAGQHEILADQLQRNFPQEIKQAIKDAQKIIETLKKDLKGCQATLDKSYKNLDKTKLKYVKYQEDFTLSKDSQNIPGQNIEEIRAKEKQAEEQKVDYAVQLVKTNKCQAQYYECDLPDILGKLEKLCEGQHQYFVSVMSRCVASEQTVAPIISKCQEDMMAALERVDVKAELSSVVERNKTGGVPPGEIQFDDLSLDPSQVRGVITPCEPIELSIKSESGVFLYQEKRTLQKKIKQQEEEIQKGEREILALTKMVNTYKANPKFGCADKLCEQLDMSVQRVEILRSGVQLLRGDLDRVLSRLEIIKMSNETYSNYYSNYSLSGRSSGIYQTPDLSSSDVSKEYESIDKIAPNKTNRGNVFYGYCGEDDQSQGRNLDQIESCTPSSKVNDWVNHCSKTPSPPPPPLPSQPPIQLLAHVVALYPFVGEVENSLSMEEGEELMVTEADVEGWTRVRRLDSSIDQKMEGFVPSSFIKFLS